MIKLPEPDYRHWETNQWGHAVQEPTSAYTSEAMHAYAAAVSAADNDVLREAIQHYEAALKLSWPEGAMGDAFDCWNHARILLEGDK